MKEHCLIAILVFAAASMGCAKNDHPLREPERRLGTGDKLNWTFHRVVEDSEGIGYRFPGYLIGIEKSKRDLIGIADTDDRLNIDNFSGNVKKRLIKRLNDGKRTFISHITRYDLSDTVLPRISTQFRHNIYAIVGRDPEAAGSAYALSWQAMDDLRREVRRRMADEEFTHVFVFAMGWNTDQQEAVRNYNSLFGNLMAAAEKNAGPKPFKPLFFGFSWPSSWRLPAVSYFNKANDADEVGAVWINVLLSKVLLPLKLKENGDFDNLPTLGATDRRILLVDASDVIRFGTYAKGGKSHSDIYKPEIAEFMWRLIQTHAR